MIDGHYIKCKIDGDEEILSAFTEEAAPDVIISSTVTTEEGWHMMTKIEMYNKSNILVAESKAAVNFNVVASRTTQIDIDMLFLDPVEVDEDYPKKMSARVLIKGMTYGYAFLKSKGSIPPTGEDVSVKMTGILGIPEDEIHFYQEDDLYSQHPVKSYTKCVFSIQYIHNGDDPVWTMYDWGTSDPLVLNYHKTGNPEDTDVFKIQTYRVLEVDGVKEMREVISSTDWRFTLKGDEDFVLNDKGLVEFSYLPVGWESEMIYQFEY